MKISLFPCLSAVNGSIYQPIKCEKEQYSKFLVSLSLQACEKWALRFRSTCDVEKDLIILYRPLICQFPPMVPPLCFHFHNGVTSSNAMVKVWAKHANCSVFGCTDEHRAVDLLMYLLYIMLQPHRSNITNTYNTFYLLSMIFNLEYIKTI